METFIFLELHMNGYRYKEKNVSELLISRFKISKFSEVFGHKNFWLHKLAQEQKFN